MPHTPENAVIRSYITQLAYYAALWRGRQRQHQSHEAQQAIQQYHAVMELLWALPWEADLDPDEELPDDLMPLYYINYWATYHQLQRQLSVLADQWRDAMQKGKHQKEQMLLQEYHRTLRIFFDHAREDKRLISPDNAILPMIYLPDWYRSYLQHRHDI